MIPIVYTMGKVGSTAISRAIKQAGYPCFDFHTLDAGYIHKRMAADIRAGRVPPAFLPEALATLSGIVKRPSGALYISVVREPISRNLSAFFENLALYFPDATPKPQQVIDAFLAHYPHDLPVRWFDREFKRFLGIDIYSEPFDRELRLQRWDTGPSALVFRNDTYDDLKAAEIAAEMNIPLSLTIRRENVGTGKAYAALYEEVRGTAKFPKSYLDRMYDTQFAKHFWTEDELDAMRAQWE